MDNEKLEKLLSHAQSLIMNEEFNSKVEAMARNGNGTISQVPNRQVINEAPKPVSKPITKATNSQDMIPSPAIDKPLSVNVAPPQTSGNYQLNERYQQQPMPNVGIDYSLIKTIIDESVRNTIKEYMGNTLNENTEPRLMGMRIGNGNKIQMIDTKGNLYEGVLKLKKKA